MEKIVLTEEEITKIKGLKDNFQNLVNAVGNLEIQIMSLQMRKEQMKSEFHQIQENEIVIAKELEDKYGQGSISLETGEFLPIN